MLNIIPEFTTIEAYLAYADMDDMMDLVEGCLSTVTKDILGTYDINYQDQIIHMQAPWKRGIWLMQSKMFLV